MCPETPLGPVRTEDWEFQFKVQQHLRGESPVFAASSMDLPFRLHVWWIGSNILNLCGASNHRDKICGLQATGPRCKRWYHV